MSAVEAAAALDELADLDKLPADMDKLDKSGDLSKLTVLGSLVPARVIRYHLHNTGEHKLKPFSEEYDGAVLFADISGFSSLAEKLAKDLNCAANAAENLSSYIGKSLEMMVQAVCSKGGDVIKFAGDAILAVFPVDRFNGDLEEATLCCTRVALDLLNLDLRAGGVELSVHCGVGAGKVISYHVGGLHGRWEYVITGDPVDQIGSAEPEAEAGEVVIAEAAYKRVAHRCKGTTLKSGNFKVDDLTGVVNVRDQPLVFGEFDALLQQPSELLRMEKTLRSYVPRPVLQAIDSGQSLWFSELRPCSTLFCRLKGLRYTSALDLDLIQQAVLTVQKQIYTYEGTLCRFIVDDKGAGLLLAFGLPPYMHENDPVRAIKSALDVHSSIRKMKNEAGEELGCSIGVTSGRVFCGTTGGKIRCEYTLHGTLVNLAARYMVAAKDGVLCGEVTHKESKQFVSFKEPMKLTVKGRKEAVLVYRPIEAIDLTSFDNQASSTPIVGRKHEREVIDSCFRRLKSRSGANDVVLISGDAGIGKSRLMQHAFRKGGQSKLTTLLGFGVDTEQATPLYVFKSILTQLVPIYYTKVIRHRFKLWLQIKGEGTPGPSMSSVSPISPGSPGGFATPQAITSAATSTMPTSSHSSVTGAGSAGVSPKSQKSFSRSGSASPSVPEPINLSAVFTEDLSESFYQSIDKLVESRQKAQVDESSEQLLRYMGFTEAPIEEIVEKGTYDPPPYDKLTDKLKKQILRDMIPGDKGNLKDMFPLLSAVMPLMREVKDNDTTQAMKKELRAENLNLLIKEVFVRCVQEIERLHEYQEMLTAQHRRLSKAFMTLGVEEGRGNPSGLTSGKHSTTNGSTGGGSSSGLSSAIGGRGQSRNSATSDGRFGSMSREGSENSSSLGQVREGEVSLSKNSTMLGSPNGPGKETSYRMRMGGPKDENALSLERLVIMVEDLQWVDPASIKLLEQISKEVRPILLILSCRPSDEPPLDVENIELLQLSNLSREEVREGMCMWLKVKEIPDKALTEVMEKSDGHPLFSAELTKLMEAEGMLIIENDTCKLSKKAQEGKFVLPDTISALMTSKLDRLPPSQQLALKVAAVIGTEFHKHELVALMPRADNEEFDDDHRGLSNDVSNLVKGGLLTRDSGKLHLYRFTNAMLRESAYNLLLFQSRKEFHGKLAEFHEERNKEYLEPVYFLLATNYHMAEVVDKAILYSELAGNDALDLHAMRRVLICFNRLLELDERFPQETKHIPLERKVGWKRKVGEALLHLGKPKDAQESFEAALAQIELLPVRSVMDASSCLPFMAPKKRPMQLAKHTHAFQEMVRKKSVELMLEAANTFELLGKINNDRRSVEALEYRTNALDLARAAEQQLKELPDGLVDPSIAAYENNDEDAPLSPMDLAISALARSYAYLAVFLVRQGEPGKEEFARDNIRTASLLVDRVKDSETQALVHFKCSEFSAMMGELKQAGDGVRKALWVCQFLNYERMNLDCQELAVTIATFLGKFGKARRTLQQAIGRMPMAAPNYPVLAVAARVFLFTGDFKSAEDALERIGRLQPGSLNEQFEEGFEKLIKSDMPETLLALSMLAMRKHGRNDLALEAANAAAEKLANSTIPVQLPLVSFHSVAFLFTAFADCLGGVTLQKPSRLDPSRSRSRRLSISQIVPMEADNSNVSSRLIRHRAKKHLRQISDTLKRYAKVYRPCQPHVTYCQALHSKMVRGRTSLKQFLVASDQADASGSNYVRALSLLQVGLADPSTMHNAELAFKDCMEAKLRTLSMVMNSPEDDGSSILNAEDAPWELRLLVQSRK